MKNDIYEILRENERRKETLTSQAHVEIETDPQNIDPERCRTDFEYWAANTVRIRDKRTGRRVHFLLNRPQRRVLRELENMRLNNRPIRLIMLKARQWGGSTLVQYYMLWIQMVHRREWNSVICAHVKDSARNIRNMITSLVQTYPSSLVQDDVKGYGLVGFEGAQNVKVISGRDCRVAVSSAECQDSVRGFDISMAHLSEVAFWKTSPNHDPDDFFRAVCSAVPPEPYTFVAIESTANGVGNFFHNEWLRAVEGRSDKHPVFVPWYEIDMHSLPVGDAETFWNTMTPYERDLWYKHRCTLEQIAWYRHKRSEYSKAEHLHAEFPTTPQEAFVSADANVFFNGDIERLREGCGESRRGELSSKGWFGELAAGNLELWEEPREGAEYVVAVDVGGRSDRSDWSVIAVLKDGERPEVVAQWRGHIDHDLLADKAMALATWYNLALLVIESNTLESADDSTSSISVLERVAREYPQTYRRSRRRRGSSDRECVGFHTNRHTKCLIIDNLTAVLRDGSYIERDVKACNELSTYCRLPNGSYEARRGCHDDILMTRAIALHILRERRRNSVVGLTAHDMPTTSVFDW